MKNFLPSVSRIERGLWIAGACLVVATAVIASSLQQGPFFVADSNGTAQVAIGSGSATAAAPGGNITLGKGTIVYADPNLNSWGHTTGPAIGSTASISVTFGTAEPDTNYRILLVTDGLTTTAAPFSMGDRYAQSFAIKNPGGHNSDLGVTWFKFRTTTP